ncbi:MAG: hypothetical protein KAS32_27205, partial [Candidatus Peribacteraceae bacterium]|nr:hypothetical protein [Candidatus Peribacteraceae bacterium]
RRPIEETVDSYMKKTEGRNHWCSDGESKEDLKWDVCYPSYDMTNKRNAVRRYWREYYHKAINLQTEYPDNVKIFNYDTLLNTKKGQDDMFNFVGVRGYVNHLDIVMNKSNT